MVIYIPTAVIFLYLLFRLVLRSRCSKTSKVVAALVLLLVSQAPLLKSTFFGNLSAPELPPAVLLVQGWSFVCLLVVFVLVVIRDVLLLLAKIAKGLLGKKAQPQNSESTGRAFIMTLGFLPAAYLGLQILLSGLVVVPTAYGVHHSIDIPNINYMDVALPELPKELDGLVVVQLTDMHISPLITEEWTAQVIERVNALEPDLILFTGDLFDGLPEHRAKSVELLKNLKATYGLYGSSGNHEYYNGFAAWMEVISGIGIDMLLNEHRVLEINGQKLVLAGVTDRVADTFGLPMPDIQAALSGAPEGAAIILLDHRPDTAPLNAGFGVDLQLSGHTHGGQVVGMNQLVALFNDGFVYGWYNVQGMSLYVSSGAGLWNGFPIRLGVPPEIPCFTLRSESTKVDS